ncbi:beta-ketoacyl synthase [Tamlana sedimentorum]|uniref:Beta-ketoacyl synthase n=1 Tax=Neotamlana sedimentorum TaxID=1435349 RepID=A0A0D7W4Z0_9FLAO|nr:beta-ketoacyl synthase N-terminal-like domain-containing protein [Tamlana sedimentorum]KJD33753.1 beta-ketoacyl synthase [Tamlana sedimentorum]
MSKVYLSYNNIISSLGFNSASVAKEVMLGNSGLKQIKDTSVMPEPFMSSLIDDDVLTAAFKNKTEKKYTKLEKMFITSLQDTLGQSNIALTDRVGLIISTTKGNIDALDAENDFPKERAYLDVLAKNVAHYFDFKSEPIVLSNACVSGVLAVAVAKRYIKSNMFDQVFIVAGDLVTEFILSGFNSFQALSSEICKPYDKNRIGINIGEVAVSALVTKNEENLSDEAVEILGEASCNDANHISGPSRTGEGLYRSIESALAQSNLTSEDIDYISAHGTATMYNDEMEAIALNRLSLEKTPMNSLKGYFGHTLGASGLLETIIGMYALNQNVLIKTLGFAEMGVTQPINVIENTVEKPLSKFLKTASGFGGCNTAVIFKKVK